MHASLSLPEPDAEAAAHSRKVQARLLEAVRAAGGWLDFADYMDLALYAPGLGYYSAGARKFGAAGDFITAPELGPLFARALARTLRPVLDTFGERRVLEIGAGTGALAADLLTALGEQGCVPREYLILEVSADLRERQADTLGRLAPAWQDRVRWLDRLPPRPLEAVVIGNEVADAIPVSRFRITPDGPVALGVTARGDALAWAEGPAGGALGAACASLEAQLGRPFVPGYTSEICLRLPAWVAALAGTLERGLIWLADYGLPRAEYYHPQRSGGTLVCHYRHRAHSDPFSHPGLTDISAWVDFTALAESAVAAGLNVAGYTTQAQFLLAAGILDQDMALPPGRDAAAAAAALRTLLMPGEMGEAFKVMTLTRGLDTDLLPPARDLRHLL